MACRRDQRNLPRCRNEGCHVARRYPAAWSEERALYRLHRRHYAKFETRIYGYVDLRVPMLARMFEKRLCAYRAMGYELAGAGLNAEDDESENGWTEE